VSSLPILAPLGATVVVLPVLVVALEFTPDAYYLSLPFSVLGWYLAKPLEFLIGMAAVR